jgi:hypothetical protein
MTAPAAPIVRPAAPGKSAVAIVAGLLVVIVASLATDQLLHVVQVYPPWGEPMRDPGLNLLALAYRCIYAVLGGYVAARLAPRNAMWHALLLGIIGLALSTLGAIAAIPLDLGPAWYPIALAASSIPCSWLGGILHRRRPPRPGA